MHLGGLPVILDVFVVTVLLVRLFVHADRFVDWLLAQLHPLRRKGGRAPGLLLSPRGASALHPRSCFVVRTTGRTSALTLKEK